MAARTQTAGESLDVGGDIETATESETGGFDRILLALEEDTDEHVIETALALANAHGATIEALSVVRMQASIDHWDTVVERREESAERALDAAGELAADADVTLTKQLRYGTPAEEVGLYAGGNDVDLVVTGEPETSGLGRLLSGRSTTRGIQRAVSVPVVTVPSL